MRGFDGFTKMPEIERVGRLLVMTFVGSALTPRTTPLCCAPAIAYPLSPVISANYSPLHKSEAAIIVVFELWSEIL